MKSFELGAGARCDLQKLVDSRLLIQANSGGGKSWALRRLLEQTHGQVQHLVIDPEGEFATLRERFDYVLAARSGGETYADPRPAAAKLLAERLLELGVSAILDIYELKAHERVGFVRHFLEALVNAKKDLWHPVLVVVDEAHVFCPEKGEAESAAAVIDLATRGRKRGFCAVLATQRLSKLAKDAAAECNNKLIGRTGLDVDMKRAGDELGFTKERQRELRDLEAGDFFVFGPALTRAVQRIHVGPVSTSHPKAGARLAAPPPPPTAKIKALLPQLADLPAEAQERTRTLQELQKELATTKRQLTLAQRGAPVAPAKERVVEKRVEVAVLKEGQLARFEKVMGGLPDRLTAAVAPALAIPDRITAAVEPVVLVCREIAAALGTLNGNGHRPPMSPTLTKGTPRLATASAVAGRPRVQSLGAEAGSPSPVSQRILNALAELELLGAAAPERALVAFLSGYTNLASKGFANAIGALRTAGHIGYPNEGTIAMTEPGRAVAEFPDAPRSSEEVQRRICQLLGGASERILRPLIDAYPDALPRTDVAGIAGYGNLASKGFANAIGRLRTLGFIEYPERGTIRAASILFLEAR